MSGADVAALVAVCVATGVAGALAVVLVQLRRTLTESQRALSDARTETLAALEALREVTRRAEFELDRVDALYGSAEAISERTDAASRLAYRAVSNPFVKAAAFGAGTRRALRRLRSEE